MFSTLLHGPLSSVLKYDPNQPRDESGRFATTTGRTRAEILKLPKATYSKLAEQMDVNTDGHIDVQAVKEALKKGGKLYLEVGDWDLSRIDTSSITADVDASKASSNKGSVIIGANGEILDGRHRIASALKAGKKTISAWVPADDALATATDADKAKKAEVPIFKYDPNQKRDERGRWVDHGGAAHALAKQKNVRDYNVADVVSQALGGDKDTIKAFYDSIEEANKADKAGLTTNRIHSVNGDGTGGYTKERRKLHGQIINQVLANAEQAQSETPTLVVLGGRGGSGKSNFDQRRNKEFGVYSSAKSIVIDPDAIKEMLPEYEPSKAFLTHYESAHIADRVLSVARKRKLNVTLDITLRNDHSHLADRFKEVGYRVEAHFMHKTPKGALLGAVERWNRETTVVNPITGEVKKYPKGRLVPPYVIESNVNNEKNFDRLARKADNWSVVTNESESGFAGRKVSEKTKKGESMILVAKSDAINCTSYAHVLKANPYKDASGKFTTKEKAVYRTGNMAELAKATITAPYGSKEHTLIKAKAKQNYQKAMEHGASHSELVKAMASTGLMTSLEAEFLTYPLSDEEKKALVMDSKNKKTIQTNMKKIAAEHYPKAFAEYQSLAMEHPANHPDVKKAFKKVQHYKEYMVKNGASEELMAEMEHLANNQPLAGVGAFKPEDSKKAPTPPKAGGDTLATATNSEGSSKDLGAPKGSGTPTPASTPGDPKQAAKDASAALGGKYYETALIKGKDSPEAKEAYAKWSEAKDVWKKEGATDSEVSSVSAALKYAAAKTVESQKSAMTAAKFSFISEAIKIKAAALAGSIDKETAEAKMKDLLKKHEADGIGDSELAKAESNAKKKFENEKENAKSMYKSTMVKALIAEKAGDQEALKTLTDEVFALEKSMGGYLKGQEYSDLQNEAIAQFEKLEAQAQELAKVKAGFADAISGYDDPDKFQSVMGNKKFMAHHVNQINALDGDTHSVIGGYTGSAFRKVNKEVGQYGTALAGGGTPEFELSPTTIKSMQAMDKAFAQTTLGMDVKLRRNMPQKYFWEQLGVPLNKLSLMDPAELDSFVGKVYKETAFSSTSTNEEFTSIFSKEADMTGALTLRIRATKNQPGLYVDSISTNAGEREVVLPRGTTYIIRGIRRNEYSTYKFEVDVDMLGAFPDKLEG